MSNVLKVGIKGLEALRKKFEAEEKNTLRALTKAHSKVAAQAERMLKRGLSWRAGRNPSAPDYQTSPKGSLPYMHSGRLRRSIGYKILTRGKKVTSSVGSGARNEAVEYAKYLQGNNNDGIRPFLDYIEGAYNAEVINAEFNSIFEPLSGN